MLDSFADQFNYTKEIAYTQIESYIQLQQKKLITKRIINSSTVKIITITAQIIITKENYWVSI